MSGRPPKLPTGYSQAADDPGLPLDVLAHDVQLKANAAGMKAKAAAWTLITKAADLREAGQDGEARGLLEAAQALLEEMYRWKDAWSSATVHGDRQLREAMARSESCEHHGQEIRQLQAQITHLDTSREKSENGRLALLGLLHGVRDFLTAYARRGARVVRPEEIVDWLRKAEVQTTRAHDRAWNPPKPRPKGKP